MGFFRALLGGEEVVGGAGLLGRVGVHACEAFFDEEFGEVLAVDV